MCKVTILIDLCLHVEDICCKYGNKEGFKEGNGRRRRFINVDLSNLIKDESL